MSQRFVSSRADLAVSEIVLEARDQRLVKGDAAILLTEMEFALLKLLFVARGRFVAREDLRRLMSPDTEPRTLDRFISNLRRKISAFGLGIAARRNKGCYLLFPRKPVERRAA
jgi:DNA-binding response OmpR family regulator